MVGSFGTSAEMGTLNLVIEDAVLSLNTRILDGDAPVTDACATLMIRDLNGHRLAGPIDLVHAGDGNYGYRFHTAGLDPGTVISADFAFASETDSDVYVIVRSGTSIEDIRNLIS